MAPPPLTPQQVNALRASGISDQEILQYLNGGLSTKTSAVLGGNLAVKIGGTPYKAGTTPPDPFGLNPAYKQNVQSILNGGSPTPAPTANKAGSSTLGNVLKSLTGNTNILDKLKQLGSNVFKNAQT